MSQNSTLLALDVGEKRIGIAVGDTTVKIARPLQTINVDGTEVERICTLTHFEKVDTIVIGYPRNQSGESTQQTQFVESFKERLAEIIEVPLVFQDESLTSVIAEDRLKASGKPYAKEAIDAEAAALILQDYLERRI